MIISTQAEEMSHASRDNAERKESWTHLTSANAELRAQLASALFCRGQESKKTCPSELIKTEGFGANSRPALRASPHGRMRCTLPQGNHGAKLSTVEQQLATW